MTMPNPARIFDGPAALDVDELRRLHRLLRLGSAELASNRQTDIRQAWARRDHAVDDFPKVDQVGENLIAFTLTPDVPVTYRDPSTGETRGRVTIVAISDNGAHALVTTDVGPTTVPLAWITHVEQAI